jgi:hypothetical protein
MKNRRSRRLGKFLGLPMLAVCGFAIAATLASVGLATGTTTTDTSTPSTSIPSTTTTTTTTTTPEGGEGCTPGFWKNNADKKEASQWTDPFDPTDLVSSVFSAAPSSVASLTLLEGLSLGGGGVNALTRQAIAAVLSAAHPDIDYPLSVSEIVTAVNAAYLSGDADVIEDLKNELDTFNNLGCDISQNA